ncbi:MAG: hypothetical protein AB7L28_00965 [Kofleriaceae bacterium]
MAAVGSILGGVRLAALGVIATIASGACQSPPSSPDAALADPVTYHETVAPLLARHCSGCHREGGVAPFPLTTYDDASELADQIARVTSLRIMPPWPSDSSGACGTFIGQRWLSETEIEQLGAWAAAGAPAGDPKTASPVPAPPPMTPFNGTLSLGSDTAYVVRPGPDEYRCFVVDPGLAADHYITAMAAELDRAEVVHHFQLFVVEDEAAELEVDARVAADPEPGYGCDNEGVGDGLRWIGAWAPGDTVRRWTTGTGVQVPAGRRLVVQLHYHNHTGEPVLDHTRLGLELAASVDKVGDFLSDANRALRLPPGRDRVEVTGVHPVTLDAPIWARGARIHMHNLGVEGRLELVRDDKATCLLSIPRWDFNWQLFYLFEQPIEILPGDQIRLRCTYDTRSVSEPVIWGISTDDEMCIGYTYVTR